MESATVGSYRLKVKLGMHEFDADGPEAAVKEQFALFLSIANTAAQAGKSPKPPKDGDVNRQDDEQDIEALWNRAYRRQEDLVSLHVLPQSKTQNADAILLILYGYQMLRKEDSVTSLVLMDAAQQSGLRVDRIDRNIPASHRGYIIKGGSGKGSRYSLNNRGLTHAQGLLEEMFE